MQAFKGSLAATGNSEVLAAHKGTSGFSYRLNWTRTGGTLEYDIGYTADGKPMFSLMGTWAGTVLVQRAPGRGGSNLDWDSIPGESYTANDSRVLE